MNLRRHSISRLPSLPTIAVEILRIFGDPDASVAQIAAVVQADPAIAGKVLKAANSSRYGLTRRVANLNQAITMLGKSKVTPLVLSFSLSTESIESPEHAAVFKHYWLRSFVQATAAEVAGRHLGAGFAAECFTVNLLASIGQLALLKSDADAYIGCVDRSRLESLPLADVEREVFGASHCELSVEMLSDSGLPERCIEAITYISASNKRPAEDKLTGQLGTVACLADAFARYLCDNQPGIALIVLQERLAELGCPGLTIDRLTEEVRKHLDESASLFDIDPTTLPDPEDLLHDALEQLSEFTAMMHDDAEPQVPTELVAENGRLKQQVRDLLRQTTTDALTGTANRAFFDRRMQELNQQCTRRGETMGIAVIDIDHFKKVNDTYGHQCGDHVLQQVAQALSRVTRSNETLARYGGEEFAVLMEDIAPSEQAIMGERLRSTVESLHVEFEGTMIPVTVSVGIAIGVPDGEDFSRQLFALADGALYEAKRQGRNRIVIDESFAPLNYFSQKPESRNALLAH